MPIYRRLIHIFSSILYFTDTMVCTGCCATLDYIVTYLFKQVTMKGRGFLHKHATFLSDEVELKEVSPKKETISRGYVVGLLCRVKLCSLA